MLPIGAVRRSLSHLGYDQDLIETNWDTSDGIQDDPQIALPLVAFWDHPFDRFRSAVAVAEMNGTSARLHAKKIVFQTVSHVLLCDDNDVELWLLDRDDVKREQKVPLGDLTYLFRRHADTLTRASVAKQKIRLRQYALYETDPQGRSFGDWAVKPTVDHAHKVFSRPS